MHWHSPQHVASLLQEESAGLRALAASLVRCDADADDCVQDACVAALRAPPPAKPVAWLRAVVRHGAFRRARDAARRRRRESVRARPEHVPSARDLAERMETRQRVLAAVEALDEPYRTTVSLRYFEGLSPAEIAAAQAVPVKTVKTRLHRALARLRAALDEWQGGRRAAWMSLVASAAGGAPVLGGAIAMKKAAVVVLALALLAGAGWWLGLDDTSRRSEAPAGAPERSLDAPALAGSGKVRPAPAPAPEPTVGGRLDPVPENTFAGQVVDEAGRGVARATVRLVWQRVKVGSSEAVNGSHLLLRRERERHEAPTTTTDADGYFRFDRPYGSMSLLRAEAEGYPAALSGPHASGSFAVVRLDRSAWLSVRVATEEGKPLADAEVRLATSSVSGGTTQEPRQVLEVRRTDAAGRVRLAGVLTDHASLEVAPREAEWGVVERRVEKNERDVEIRVPAVKLMERRVVDAETGLPVPGAWVDLQRSFEYGSPDHEGWRRRFLADQEGVVRFSWQEGYYSGYASAQGYEVVHAWDEPIRLTRAARIEGTVTDPDGKAVEGAAILVAVPDAGPFQDAYVGRSPVAAWSDAAGNYSLHVVLPHAAHGKAPPDRGVRSILALHLNHVAAVADAVPVAPGTTRRVDLRFPRSASLAVEVVDKEGKPIAGQWFSVERTIPRGPTWKAPDRPYGIDTIALVRGDGTQTDADGRALKIGLPPGPHLVRVENTRAEVELREGERSSVRIVKGAGPRITGRLVDANGEPMANENVSLSGTTAAARSTDAEGRFAFDDLPPGEYGVGASDRASRGLLHASVRAKPGDDVTLRLPAGPARLAITVEGPPAGTAEFSLFTETGGHVPGGTGFAPIADATPETPPFNPGTGVLVVRAPGYGWTAVRFEAPALKTTPVAVTLAPAGMVEARVPEAALALERESKRGLLRITRTDDMVRRAVGDDDIRLVTGGVNRLVYAIQRSRGSPDDHVHAHVDGLFRFADAAPGSYEVSYGHYEENGAWLARVRANVVVTSGATATAEFDR